MTTYCDLMLSVNVGRGVEEMRCPNEAAVMYRLRPEDEWGFRCAEHGTLLRPDLGVIVEPVRPTVDRAARQTDLDLHMALNTYESPGVPPTVVAVPMGLDVVGANNRRLLVRQFDEGVWIGGCLISDRGDLEMLVSYLSSRADAL
jgi:hypothetical protein